MESKTPERLTALGHPQRLAVFRLLMRRYPDRVPASELAGSLGLKANTLSTYLGTLRQVGLIAQERAGTSLRYSIEMEAVREMMGHLLLDCCRGRPEICDVLSAPSEDENRVYAVLFLCTGNSARSIFAEAILRDLGGTRFRVYSAGTSPASSIHLIAGEVLRQQGHDLAGLAPMPLSAVQGPEAPTFDFVFTVCDKAANEDCPAWPGQPISAHWGLPDPVAVSGTKAEKALAFKQTYGALRERLSAFAALPIETLDRMALQQAVDDIGRVKEEA